VHGRRRRRRRRRKGVDWGTSEQLKTLLLLVIFALPPTPLSIRKKAKRLAKRSSGFESTSAI
jgi:hypothetical protein